MVLVWIHPLIISETEHEQNVLVKSGEDRVGGK